MTGGPSEEETTAVAATDPANELRQMILGFVPTQILYAAVDLGVAEELADGPHAYGELAGRTGTDPAALRRLLRALAGLGVVTQLDMERFELTDSGRLLASSTEGSVADEIRLSVAPELWRAWGALPQVVRTGSVFRDPVDGLTAHESLLRRPGPAAALRAGKAAGVGEFAAHAAAVYDFSVFGTIADLGGDDGTLIAALLTAVPGARAVLQDLPEALDTTVATLKAAGVAERCETVAGVLGESVPLGADAYLLNNIVRDLDDEDASALLRRCRAAMAPAARLLLVETLMPAVLTPAESSAYGLTDLNNLVFAGGRERTRDEYAQLLAASGFTLTATVAVPVGEGMPDYHVLEGTPSENPGSR
ncbi:methyltransferase [Streptomyces sp. NBC_01235]|uniref:methyltransferase n=1 Tax=Streptomyces sp. NBC_01235 TaxID=2903788 RepID=UPI002E0D6198|nr:methyltransferase [Streptomyces sp. NBC_01235]